MPMFLRSLTDQQDERLARRRREALGRARWLVSWMPSERGGPWLARLSCPQWPDTVESTGRTRCEAISRAELILNRALSGAIGTEADS